MKFLVPTLLATATFSSSLTLHSRRWSSPPPASLPACPAEVDGLISGIEINILAQQGERSATEALQAIETTTPVDAIAFAAGKAVLVSDIMFGMTIRAYNQMIAPAGNLALAGLATVRLLANLTQDPMY